MSTIGCVHNMVDFYYMSFYFIFVCKLVIRSTLALFRHQIKWPSQPINSFSPLIFNSPVEKMATELMMT